MQAVKAHPKIRGSQIPYISAIVGICIGVGWYLVSGGIDDGSGFLGVDWANIFRGLFNGVAGAVSANGAFNLQKILPIPNILPTSGEMNESALRETVTSVEQVKEAAKEGVPIPDAKDAVGLDENDPPPENTVVSTAADTTIPTSAPVPTAKEGEAVG